jgi:hypothetical protein
MLPCFINFIKIMKTKFLLGIILVFSSGTCFAQEEQEEFSSVFSTKQNSLFTLSKFSTLENNNIASPANQNAIYIQQIGNNNQARTTINSSNSIINLNQNGSDNFIFLDKTANQINQFVAQKGSNNNVIDFNLATDNPINSNFTQTGNNLNIINIGANSLSKELTVRQSGNSGSVIILNK